MTSPVAHACCKCGSEDYATTWHRDDVECGYSSWRRGISMPLEHLHYHCRCCGFEWVGPCLDSQPAEGA